MLLFNCMSSITRLIFLIPIGLLPGIIWLLYFLGEDRKKPEPKGMIIKTFCWGMLIALVAIIIEFSLGWTFGIDSFYPKNLFQFILTFFIVSAAVEEYLKYFVVKTTVLKKPAFDEPIDAMIYCIIAALGFASVENLMIVWGMSLKEISNPFGVMALRFVGATLLHALASGIVGYWLGKAWFSKPKKSKFAQTILVGIGLTLAIIFHGLFNWAIVTLHFEYVALLLGIMIIIVYLGFHRLRRLEKFIHSG